MTGKKLSRKALSIAALAIVAVALGYAFWPRPVIVDMGVAARGDMMLTIDEEGQTRVQEVFVVSTPSDGRLLRVEVHAGDPVEANATVVARMRPANPAALDLRTREQATAAVEAAQAALRVSEANLEAARADLDLSQADLERTQQLASSGTASPAALDRARGAERAAKARLNTAEAAIAQRKAELQSAQAQLIGFDDRGLLALLEAQLGDETPIYAPADGVILKVINEDETTLAAGSPILEIGDIGEDLEVVVELISSDAVRVERGAPVIVENWGGEGSLAGTVTRISPLGETRVSALGVEEQRVTVYARLSTPPERRPGLGHGFSVDARIVIWSAEDALLVPSPALFREKDGWAVFRVADGRADRVPVEIGADNGEVAQVTSGLEEGEIVVLYPPPELKNGAAVERRVILE